VESGQASSAKEIMTTKLRRRQIISDGAVCSYNGQDFQAQGATSGQKEDERDHGAMNEQLLSLSICVVGIY
jgi:hypothetical protein